MVLLLSSRFSIDFFCPSRFKLFQRRQFRSWLLSRCGRSHFQARGIWWVSICAWRLHGRGSSQAAFRTEERWTALRLWRRNSPFLLINRPPRRTCPTYVCFLQSARRQVLSGLNVPIFHGELRGYVYATFLLCFRRRIHSNSMYPLGDLIISV